jgi:hypothetical protein
MSGEGSDSLEKAWGETEAAADFAPLPRGEYEAVLVQSGLFNSRSGTPGVKLEFEVRAGEFKGRKFWHDLWLTTAALPMSKRDLLKLGIKELADLEKPLPALVCKVVLSLRTNDDGVEFNRVNRFEVVGAEPSDPFAVEGAA